MRFGDLVSIQKCSMCKTEETECYEIISDVEMIYDDNGKKADECEAVVGYACKECMKKIKRKQWEMGVLTC